MNKTIFTTGIIFGTTAVILGAFAAHGLKNVLDVTALESFETGVTYQMYHAFALMILGSISKVEPQKKKLVYWLYTIGVVFFSLSIYLLALNNFLSFDFKTIAFITPIGGLLLILGWIFFGIRYFRS
ncbi:DUF423 domain-containing protein [Cellulophaga baltica]|uniref:DUF423 domain-containing protein n=1 Tax=Cellulophaga TaxID=104264 RepID=UPI001C06BCA4|nr:MULTISPECIES: DUF423 domain-containing protein [Cellulophaga]MBU2995556.1 DUF423 domain-containing protein [Cellulophaga baltica]MDO6766950.1 DUF423 domain-containing protein [Cellulophaga sp. 1_MG-2023]